MFLNSPELVNTLNNLPIDGEEVIIDIVEQDFSTITFEQQARIVGSSSIIIGMHGSGIASSVHMPVGTKYCCGVIEIFPAVEEFKSIRGYGNMARRMGHHYRRLELLEKDTSPDGSSVPAAQLESIVMELISSILKKPSCLLPAVIKRPI